MIIQLWLTLFIILASSFFVDTKQEEHVHTNCTQPGLFALTFDDGPSTGRTDEVLDVLKLNNVTATFFVTGQTYGDLETLPSQNLLKRILAEGHEIGVHTWSHRYLPDPWRHHNEVYSEISSVKDKVMEITGVNLTIMRPPYGAYNETIVDIAYGELGLDVIMWNINTLDWSHPGDTEAGLEGYTEGTKNSSADTHSFIALHHDPLFGGGAMAQAAIDFMKNLGYRFVTASECIGNKN